MTYKYRVMYIKGNYYPQKKLWFFPWTSFYYTIESTDGKRFYNIDICYSTKQGALDYIRQGE